MKKILYLFGIVVLANSCATLTKTQIESVNKFATTTKDFSAYPSKIMTELSEIRVESGLYYVSALDSIKGRVSELDKIYEQKKFDFSISQKVDVTFKIIDKYAQSLALLSSSKYVEDLDKQAEQFGVGLDSLIAINNRIDKAPKVPEGIGSVVNEVIVLGGKQFIRRKQAKEIKEFVARADTLIEVMTSNLLEFLESGNIEILIKGEERGVKRNYMRFVGYNKNITTEDDKSYLALKARLDEVKKLQKNSISATKKLRESHSKMLSELQQKKKLKESWPDLQGLFEEIKVLKESIDNIESEKE